MLRPCYIALQEALSRSRALSDAAEAHGTLTGALCAARDFRFEDWLAEVLPDATAAEGSETLLREVFAQTGQALESEELAFQPELPADEVDLSTRTAALGEWCQGFLYGLGAGALPDLRDLQGEVGEILRDLTEITRADVDPGSGEEANESAYAELVEFVRMGVQILYEELRPLRLREAQERSQPDVVPQVLH